MIRAVRGEEAASIESRVVGGDEVRDHLADDSGHAVAVVLQLPHAGQLQASVLVVTSHPEGHSSRDPVHVLADDVPAHRGETLQLLEQKGSGLEYLEVVGSRRQIRNCRHEPATVLDSTGAHDLAEPSQKRDPALAGLLGGIFHGIRVAHQQVGHAHRVPEGLRKHGNGQRECPRRLGQKVGNPLLIRGGRGDEGDGRRLDMTFEVDGGAHPALLRAGAGMAREGLSARSA